MKIRIITGLSFALLAAAALIWLQTPLLLILVTFFAVMGALELCHATGVKSKLMIAAATGAAALVPALLEYRILERLGVPALPVFLGYFILLLVLMLARFEKTRFSHLLCVLFASLAMPAALACLTLMNSGMKAWEGDLFETNLAVWLIFFTLCAAWLTDVFALFVGVKFGKHKMSPKISPKKTWEGAIGGLAGVTIFNVGFALMFNAFFLEHYEINLLAVALLSPAIGAVSMIGDLSASVLKRNHGVKDFGKFFPGHGGMMDRFDSLLLAAPFIYGLLQLEQNLGLHLLYEVIA